MKRLYIVINLVSGMPVQTNNKLKLVKSAVGNEDFKMLELVMSGEYTTTMIWQNTIDAMLDVSLQLCPNKTFTGNYIVVEINEYDVALFQKYFNGDFQQ